MASTKGKSPKSTKLSKKTSKAISKSSRKSKQSPGATLPAKTTSQIKTKRAVVPHKPKKRTYTDKELGIPVLNMITPAGVEKPKGQKKGKVFVDDQESMMTILALVNAEKEGEIESKIMKAVCVLIRGVTQTC
jgi:60S ribosomal subunit assembly/export protein LOC1